MKILHELKYQFENMTPEQQTNSPNMIHSFLYEAKQDKNTYLNDDALLHQVTNFYFAGSEVTSSLYTWMLIKTFDHPEI